MMRSSPPVEEEEDDEVTTGRNAPAPVPKGRRASRAGWRNGFCRWTRPAGRPGYESMGRRPKDEGDKDDRFKSFASDD